MPSFASSPSANIRPSPNVNNKGSTIDESGEYPKAKTLKGEESKDAEVVKLSEVVNCLEVDEILRSLRSSSLHLISQIIRSDLPSQILHLQSLISEIDLDEDEYGGEDIGGKKGKKSCLNVKRKEEGMFVVEGVKMVWLEKEGEGVESGVKVKNEGTDLNRLNGKDERGLEGNGDADGNGVDEDGEKIWKNGEIIFSPIVPEAISDDNDADVGQLASEDKGTPILLRTEAANLRPSDDLGLVNPTSGSKISITDKNQNEMDNETDDDETDVEHDDRRATGNANGSGKRWMGTLKRNEVVGDAVKILEEECEKTMTNMKGLVHFINMHSPKMEDGNNFGVEVQEKVKETCQSTLTTAWKLRGVARSHYNDRIQLGNSWCRYPNLQDHAAAIASSDRFDHFLITNGLRTLRNNLAEVLLTLKENWSKVSDPKGLEGGGGMGMY